MIGKNWPKPFQFLATKVSDPFINEIMRVNTTVDTAPSLIKDILWIGWYELDLLEAVYGGRFCFVGFVFLPTWIFKWLSSRLHPTKVHSDKFVKIFLRCKWQMGTKMRKAWVERKRTLWLADDDRCRAGDNKKQNIQNILNVKSGYIRQDQRGNRIRQLDIVELQLGAGVHLLLTRKINMRQRWKAAHKIILKTKSKVLNQLFSVKPRYQKWLDQSADLFLQLRGFYFSTFPNLTEKEYPLPCNWWWWYSCWWHRWWFETPPSWFGRQ